MFQAMLLNRLFIRSGDSSDLSGMASACLSSDLAFFGIENITSPGNRAPARALLGRCHAVLSAHRKPGATIPHLHFSLGSVLSVPYKRRVRCFENTGIGKARFGDRIHWHWELMIERGLHTGAKRSLGALAAAAVVCSGLAIYRFSARPPQRVLRIGYQNTPPLNYSGADGVPTGTAVDVIRQAAQRAGIRLEWVYYPEGSEKAIISKSVDLWPIMVDFPERHQFAYLTAPWAKLSLALVYRAPAHLATPEDVGSMRLAVATGSISDSRISRRYFPKATIVPVPNAEEVATASR